MSNAVVVPSGGSCEALLFAVVRPQPALRPRRAIVVDVRGAPRLPVTQPATAVTRVTAIVTNAATRAHPHSVLVTLHVKI